MEGWTIDICVTDDENFIFVALSDGRSLVLVDVRNKTNP